MNDPQEEIDQLKAAYEALSSQPYEAQRRMIRWLAAKLDADERIRKGYQEPRPDAGEVVMKHAAEWQPIETAPKE